MNDPVKALRELAAKWRQRISADRRDVYHDALRDAYEVAADELDAALAAMGGEPEALHPSGRPYVSKSEMKRVEKLREQPEARVCGEAVAWEATDPDDGMRWVTRNPRERDGWAGLGRTIRPLVYGDTTGVE